MWCPTGRACASAGLRGDKSSLGPFLHVEVGHRTTVRYPALAGPTALSQVIAVKVPSLHWLSLSFIPLRQAKPWLATVGGRVSLFRLSPLYHSSATPSLFLTLSMSPPSVPPYLHCSLRCPAGEQGLIWRVHNNSCNSPALAGAPQARPGPRVQCQAHMCMDGRTEILIFCPNSMVPSHDHIFASSLPFYFLPACVPKTNPHIRLLCPHSSRTACPAVKWDTGEERREKSVWSWPSL